MSFLSIPSQEGLFTTVKTDRSAEEGHFKPVDDDEDDTDDVRFIPRCSPVPRKRGHSIVDETAEYLRIQLALPAAQRRVAFADTTGGDLVDVKEFVAFDSDEEENARWEEEEARYRKPQREPTFQVHPDFNKPTDSALIQAVHTNKVEVEQLTRVEDEPLAFSGIIRVLNISFQKAVYIRSTMDSWGTYFDLPADYVQGSHDGKTDKFSFKLSFAPPYLTNGSRIEFVVRYETSDGDYWANNSQMNYVVTLLLSYEEDLTQATDMREIRSILRPPKVYSVNDDFDDEDSQDEDEEDPGTSKAKPLRPTPVYPIIVQPEIDVEAAEGPPCPPLPPNPDLPSVDGTLFTTIVSMGEQSPYVSSETTSKTNDEDLSFASQASEPLQLAESEPLPKLHCELGNQTLEQSRDSSPSTLLSASASYLPYPPISSICVATEGEEQRREISTISDPEPDTVTNSPVTEIQANTALDNIANQSLFPATSEVEKGEIEQVSMEESEGLKPEMKDIVTEEGLELSISIQELPICSINPAEKRLGPDFHESKTKGSSQTEIPQSYPHSLEEQISLDDTETDAGFLKNEERALQTESGVRSNISQASGEEGVGMLDTFFPSTANTLPPATVILCEQSPHVSPKITSETTDEELSIASQANKPLETTEPSLTSEIKMVEMLKGSVEEDEALKQEELKTSDIEGGQDLPVQVKTPPTISISQSRNPSDTGSQTEISPGASLSSTESGKKTSMDDAGSLECNEEALLTESWERFHISQAIEDKAFTNENTAEGQDLSIQVQEPSTHSISPSEDPAEVSSQTEITAVSPSFLAGPTTQKSLNDTAARCIENQLDLLGETRQRLESSQAGGEEIPGLVAPCVWLPYTAPHVEPTREDRVSHSLASHPSAELPSDYVSLPPVASLSFKQGVALSELAAVLSVDSISSTQYDENSTSAHFTPIVESPISLGAESRATPSPAFTDNTSVVTGVTEAIQKIPFHSTQAENEDEDSHQASLDTLLENPPNHLPEAAKPLTAQPEHDVGRNLMPSIVFLCGAIFFSIVLHELSALLFFGLFLVSLCF